MTADRSAKGLYLAAAFLFIAGVGYLMFSGISENSVPFVTVSEALAMPPEKLQAARIFGTVKDQDITIFNDGKSVKFLLEDSDNASSHMWVVYNGMVPDTFKGGAEVYVEGSSKKNDEPFAATTLITKCPSKYQKENRT